MARLQAPNKPRLHFKTLAVNAGSSRIAGQVRMASALARSRPATAAASAVALGLKPLFWERCSYLDETMDRPWRLCQRTPKATSGRIVRRSENRDPSMSGASLLPRARSGRPIGRKNSPAATEKELRGGDRGCDGAGRADARERRSGQARLPLHRDRRLRRGRRGRRDRPLITQLEPRCRDDRGRRAHRCRSCARSPRGRSCMWSGARSRSSCAI